MRSNAHSLSFPSALRDLRLGPAERNPEQSEQISQERERASYEQGRADGMKELNEQLMQQRTELLELQDGVIESLRQALPQLVRECEHVLTALALEAAQKLISGLPVSLEMVEAAVREALSQVEETTDYHIHLPPEDLDLLHRLNSDLVRLEGSPQRMHFHAAPEIGRGGCLIKTRFGIIDAQRVTKAGLLRQSLLT